MITQEEALSRLLGQVEEKVDRKMKTPKDFDFLVGQIYEETHRSISASTLKRLWGYVDSYPSIRESTLNLLAQFVGYESYSHFLQQFHDAPTTPETPTGKPSNLRWPLYVFLALIAVAALVLAGKTLGTTFNQRPILKCGQTFASYEEFLSLFNINATDDQHYQPIPECSIAYVWAPQYHHPTYHNDGNPDSLMPTIAEYLAPKPSDSPETRRLIIEEQKRRYLSFIPSNQVRVVFMKNLPGDTCFTFTGVYRVAYHLSDTTKVVWIRSSSECDLNHLEDLPRLRN